MLKELNIPITGDAFAEACDRLAVHVRAGYKSNVRPGAKEGYYLVSKISAPELDETVFFYGVFRTGVYGFCTCATCQEKETVCAHMVSALAVYCQDRGIKSCKLCNQLRLPNDLNSDQVCIVCLMEQDHVSNSNLKSDAEGRATDLRKQSVSLDSRRRAPREKIRRAKSRRLGA